jgi:hypothetical protein
MDRKVRITLFLLGSTSVALLVLGSGVVATGFTHATGNVMPKEAILKNIPVPDNCIILSSGELECHDSLTQSMSISIINESSI